MSISKIFLNYYLESKGITYDELILSISKNPKDFTDLKEILKIELKEATKMQAKEFNEGNISDSYFYEGFACGLRSVLKKIDNA